MKAVVMAGGEGTRLRPLTCNLPKPMVPLFDKPVMEYSMVLLHQHGIRDVAVTLQYLPKAVIDYFGSGEQWGLNLRYFIEEKPLGTAGSVANARRFLDETFMVVSGDALTDFPLSEAVLFHQKNGALITIVLTRVPFPLEYGLVLTDSSGRIKRFLEKPSWGEVFSDTVNTGIYVVEPEVLAYIPEDRPFDFSKDLFPYLLNKGCPLYACILEGYWCDIGNCEQYRQVHYDILQGRVNVNIDANCREGVFLGQGVYIHDQAEIEGPVFIGKGCQIEAGAKIQALSVLGMGTVVESYASVKNSVLWPGCHVGQRAEIRGAILGRGVKVGQGSLILEGAVVGDDIILEEVTKVKPQVKVWPNKVIEAGRVVQDSVVWANRVFRSPFNEWGVSGSWALDLTPEFMARLGKALGSLLPLSSRTMVACDWSLPSHLSKMSIIVGLTSVGVEVYDAGKVALPAFRHGVRELGSVGGVYCAFDPKEKRINLRLVDRFGIDYTKSEQRKLENIFNREEYRQATLACLREPKYIPDLMSGYFNSLVKSIDVDLVRRQRFRVAVGASNYQISHFAAGLLDHLGCDVVQSDGVEPMPYHNDFDYSAGLKNLIDKTVERNASFGVFLSGAGERAVLADQDGRIIKEEELVAVISQVFAERFKKVFLPVNVPYALEAYIRRRGHEVVRTRVFPGEFMYELLKSEEYDQLRLHTDALFLVVGLLEAMAEQGRGLKDIMRGVPLFYYDRRDIPVTWAAKGKVIRRISEEYLDSDAISMVQGVRVRHKEGTSLVLPDESYPICRIYSEAFSQEIAESLADFYEEKIKSICQEEDEL